MTRPLPCAHCGKSITQRADLVTRVVNLNFAYFCSEHCANKLKLPGLAPTPMPPKVQATRDTQLMSPTSTLALHVTAAPLATGNTETINLSAVDNESATQPERSLLSERARISLAGAFAFLGLFARSAGWTQWASAAALCAFLLVFLPLARARMRLGLSAHRAEHVGAYTLLLGLWAYVAAVYSAAWWVCAMAFVMFAWVGFGLRRAPRMPRWLSLLASGEWHWG